MWCARRERGPVRRQEIKDLFVVDLNKRALHARLPFQLPCSPRLDNVENVPACPRNNAARLVNLPLVVLGAGIDPALVAPAAVRHTRPRGPAHAVRLAGLRRAERYESTVVSVPAVNPNDTREPDDTVILTIAPEEVP